MTIVPAALLFALSACSADREPPLPEKPPADEFLRYVEEEDGSARLETAVVRMADDEGRIVDLIGAVHIADADYYDQLNGLFRRYDSLLYELVAPEDMRPTGGHKSGLSGFQTGLGDLLGLTFQLEGIDYSAENFVHADVTPERLREIIEERGDSFFSLFLSAVLSQLNATAKMDPAEAQAQSLDMLIAILSGRRSRNLKKVLARQFGQIEAAAAGLHDSRLGEVIVVERNKACIEALKRRLDAGDRRIGIFYGAMHLPDLYRRLEALGFRERSKVWLTAWSIPPLPRETAGEENEENRENQAEASGGDGS